MLKWKSFDICGEQGNYPVLNLRELDDKDLNRFLNKAESHGFAARLFVETRLRTPKFGRELERNKAVIPDKVRGTGIQLGGNLNQVWTWRETVIVPKQ